MSHQTPPAKRIQLFTHRYNSSSQENKFIVETLRSAPDKVLCYIDRLACFKAFLPHPATLSFRRILPRDDVSLTSDLQLPITFPFRPESPLGPHTGPVPKE
ncbi:hypothetical protein CEP53_014684 [Fusarium sp. AF-6]|nr:hypothetical protein CEP53_014684 [Fusarium sp. AF-6]